MTTSLSRRDVLKAVPVGTAALAAGWSGTQSSSAVPASLQTAGGTLTFGYGQQTSYSHFMFMREWAGGEWIYSRRFANAKLLTWDTFFTGFEPDLAERWEFSDDGLKLTFFLRKGLKWHDGEPFTAKDVEFTFLMQSMPGLAPEVMGAKFSPFFVGQKELIESGTTMSGMHVIDDFTISFDLINPVNPDVLFDQVSFICIAPQHLLSQYLDRDKAKDINADPWATTAAHVGLGPFRVIEYVADQYIVYEPFADYWRGKPKLDRLIYRSFADDQIASAALENKEIDVGWVPESEYERMQQLDFLNLSPWKTANFLGSPFNVLQPALSDKRVRQALLMAVDREALVAQVWHNTTEVTHSPIDVPRYGDSPNLIKYSYDPEKAKQLLSEAGWDPSRKLRWAVEQVPADDTIYAAINDYWAAVGVKTEFQIVGVDAAPLTAPEWDFDLYYSAWDQGAPQRVTHMVNTNLGCTFGCAGLSNARLEQLFAQYIERRSDEEYRQIVYELQDIMSDEVPFLTLARIPNIWGINKRVNNLVPCYCGANDWHLENVTVTD